MMESLFYQKHHGMTWNASPLEKVYYCTLLAIPALVFFYSATVLIIYTVNLPFLDDWREFSSGKYASTNIWYLFESVNDTLFVTGKLLDSIMLRLLDGNVAVYQLVSYIFLIGTIIFSQILLLWYVTRSVPVVSTSSVAFLYIMQPDTYWGKQFIAYHQGIPLACLLLTSIAITWPKSFLRSMFLVVLSIAGGLAYISGAVAYLAFTVALLLFSFVFEPKSDGRDKGISRYRSAAYTLLPPVLITLAAQLWVIFVKQAGNIHVPGLAFTLPDQTAFWAFFLGLLGRSTGASSDPTGVVITLLVWSLGAAALLTIGVRAYRVRLHGSTVESVCKRMMFVMLPLGAAVFSYLAVVTAGRAGMRPPNMEAFSDIFAFSYVRFHFFWGAALVPWIVAAWFVVTGSHNPLISKGTLFASTIIVALILVSTATRGGFGHRTYFAVMGAHRTADLNCISQQLRTSTGEVNCPVHEPLPGLRQAIETATVDGLTFARGLSATNTPGTTFAVREILEMDGGAILSSSRLGEGIRVQGDYGVDREGRLEMAAQSDPQIQIKLANNALDGCSQLQIRTNFQAAIDDVAQLFFTTVDEPNLSEEKSIRADVITGIDNNIVFSINDAKNLGVFFRLDPVAGRQKVAIEELQVECVMAN